MRTRDKKSKRTLIPACYRVSTDDRLGGSKEQRVFRFVIKFICFELHEPEFEGSFPGGRSSRSRVESSKFNPCINISQFMAVIFKIDCFPFLGAVPDKSNQSAHFKSDTHFQFHNVLIT